MPGLSIWLSPTTRSMPGFEKFDVIPRSKPTSYQLNGTLIEHDEEGFITLAGRSKEMFISGGKNVYPAEVEACFAEHPAIREVAVVGVPDERWGETGHAHVVLEPGAAADAAALTAWGRERLARFKIPSRFVFERELPKTASGKVQKHQLG